MLSKLLRTNISIWQTAAYSTAYLVGLLIIGLGLQFYTDISRDSGRDSGPLNASRYIVLSRPTQTSLFGLGAPTPITPDDIDALGKQPWADSAAPFSPTSFDMSVGISFGGRGFSTSLFCEGVPDAYLDRLPDGWGFNPESPSVSIILPADYLALYNLGFAPARGLPTIDESMARMLPLKVTLYGNGRSTTLPGKIVGFSSRINTIAVPDSFIHWANASFGNESNPPVNRVIVRLNDPGNPAIGEYLASHDFEESASGEATSRLYYFLRIILGAVMAIGLLIALLASGLLILSTFLLLQKSKTTLTDLIALGFPTSRLIRFYTSMITRINSVTLLLACALIAVATYMLQPHLQAMGLHPGAPWGTIACLAGLTAILTLTGFAIVRTFIFRIRS